MKKIKEIQECLNRYYEDVQIHRTDVCLEEYIIAEDIEYLLTEISKHNKDYIGYPG